MNELEIEHLHASLQQQLSASELARIKMKVVGPSGLSIQVDGERCLTSIGVWPNGCCDVDYLYAASEKGRFTHFEFQSEQEAVSCVLREIRTAIDRA